MKVKIGTDILNKARFSKSLERGKEAFLNRLFTNQELKQNTKEQLASVFCLKEAIIKALQLPQDYWLNISTNRKENGKIEATITSYSVAENIISLDTSISHDAELIISVAVAILHK